MLTPVLSLSITLDMVEWPPLDSSQMLMLFLVPFNGNKSCDFDWGIGNYTIHWKYQLNLLNVFSIWNVLFHSYAFWLMPMVPGCRGLRQKDYHFKTILGCIARPCFKTKQKPLPSPLWDWHFSFLLPVFWFSCPVVDIIFFMEKNQPQ